MTNQPTATQQPAGKMKAIVRTKYGQPMKVVHPELVDKPVPGDDQALVRVRAAGLNRADWYELTAPILLRLMTGAVIQPKNQMLGGDVAGVVEAVGKNVTRFKPGDEVFGTGKWGLAEYTLVREINLAQKPTNSTFEESAAVPIAAVTALQGLRDKGKVQPGQKVLVYGASGGVGLYAVQIAKALGAEVTAVTSTRGIENARISGADAVIDYSKEDFVKNGLKYDLIIQVNGFRWILAFRKALTERGAYMLIGSDKILTGLIQLMTVGRLYSRDGGRRLKFMGIARINKDDLMTLKTMIESGKVRPLIDRTYPFPESAEAFRYLGEKHAKGKVVVTMPAA